MKTLIIRIAFSASLAVMPAMAQQVTGVPGSPAATDEVWRRDQGKRPGFQAVVATARRATQRRAERVAHHD